MMTGQLKRSNGRAAKGLLRNQHVRFIAFLSLLFSEAAFPTFYREMPVPR
jgi:hypothetical protein